MTLCTPADLPETRDAGPPMQAASLRLAPGPYSSFGYHPGHHPGRLASILPSSCAGWLSYHPIFQDYCVCYLSSYLVGWLQESKNAGIILLRNHPFTTLVSSTHHLTWANDIPQTRMNHPCLPYNPAACTGLYDVLYIYRYVCIYIYRERDKFTIAFFCSVWDDIWLKIAYKVWPKTK